MTGVPGLPYRANGLVRTRSFCQVFLSNCSSAENSPIRARIWRSRSSAVSAGLGAPRDGFELDTSP